MDKSLLKRKSVVKNKAVLNIVFRYEKNIFKDIHEGDKKRQKHKKRPVRSYPQDTADLLYQRLFKDLGRIQYHLHEGKDHRYRQCFKKTAHYHDHNQLCYPEFLMFG